LRVTGLPCMIRRPRVARPPPVAAEFPATVLPMTDVLRAFVKSVAAGLQLVGLLDAPAASRLPGCAGVVARWRAYPGQWWCVALSSATIVRPGGA
jgi:hypothetical protein